MAINDYAISPRKGSLTLPQFRGHRITRLPPSLRTQLETDSQESNGALLIVEHFEVFKDLPSGFLPHPVLTVMNQFSFQRSKEAFHAGIIPTIPSA